MTYLLELSVFYFFFVAFLYATITAERALLLVQDDDARGLVRCRLAWNDGR